MIYTVYHQFIHHGEHEGGDDIDQQTVEDVSTTRYRDEDLARNRMCHEDG